MKKILIITLALLAFAGTSLLAQFRPYGSARVGYWYENADEDWSGVTDGTLNLNYYLQGNSRFGARFSDGDKSGRVEFGGTGSIRLLWASYKMGGYKILIGQDETLLTQKGTMNGNGENNFVGWGAIDNSRRTQIRFDFDNGFALALVQPQLTDVEGISQNKNVLVPKINLGYKGKLGDNMNLAGAFGLNMYNYDENQGARDESVMSFIAGLMLDMKFDDLGVKLHGNFGQNTGNYGLGSQTYNRAIWNATDEEIVNVMTMGGFGELSYKVSSKSVVTVGASYTMSDCDLYDDADTAMAAFGQMRFDLGKGFRVSPEVGMLNKMQDRNGNDKGSLMYFGTQLRMDF